MKKFLKIIIGIIIITAILFSVIYFGVSMTSEKLVCESNEGSITIMYNDKDITGYKANGITYDLEGQKAIANQVGIDAYLEQFENWFITNTSGSCK